MKSESSEIPTQQSTTAAPSVAPVNGMNGTRTTPPAPGQTVVAIKKKKKKVKPLWLALAVLVIGAAVWYGFFRTDTKTTTTYRFATAEQGTVTKAVTATGTLQATTTVQVGSQISGTIKELYADFNSQVKQGQILAQLDPTFYEAAVNEAQANLSRAQADLDNAMRDEARAKDLVAKQLIAQAEYDVTKTKLLTSRAAVQQVKAQVERAQVNLGYTTIRSPISGVVVSRNVDKGQTVAASLNAPVIFVIAQDLSSMQVAASVDEADIGQIQPGQSVKFSVDAFPGEQFEGNVSQVRLNPTTVQNVVTYSAIIDAANRGNKLIPGMTATVNIVSDSREGVLRVPAAALRFVAPPELSGDSMSKNGERRPVAPGVRRRDSTSNRRDARAVERTIYAKRPGLNKKIEKVRVVAGLSDGSFTEILSSNPPINPGDSIVIGAIAPTDPSAANKPGQQPGASPFGGAAGGRGAGGAGGGGRRGM